MSNQTLPDNTTHDYVFRTTSDAILIAGSRGVLVQVNPAAAAMLSETAESLIGKSPREVFSQNPAMMNLFNREGDQTLDVRLPRRRLAVGIATTLPGGERMVMLQDVTEKRDLESRREALVRAMAHDLRNPISAIGGFADLVGKFGDLNEQQLKFLTRIRQTTGKLQDVIGTLVELAWIEAGMPLEHHPVKVPEVIAGAIADVRPAAHTGYIVIASSIQNPMPVVMGDTERLRLVIRHLLHNAIMYSPPEQNVAIHAWEDHNEVYCSVADRGIGIADDELELIFDRMYRSRDERVREKPGGGVGLTLARTIIQRHGGDIWASSNLGQGSTFTFFLPTVRL
ncbi:MAG TPA: PAS domain-containing sensor histidine kinase [Phototrophicaceae bacterium]|nr:PAS domain-containing sensor histidine kinase [Phototrophicaceae bacterium]